MYLTSTGSQQISIIYFREQCIKNSSVSLSPTLVRNEEVEHYIRIKIHKLIVLRFWIESVINVLCD